MIDPEFMAAIDEMDGLRQKLDSPDFIHNGLPDWLWTDEHILDAAECVIEVKREFVDVLGNIVSSLRQQIALLDRETDRIASVIESSPSAN